MNYNEIRKNNTQFFRNLKEIEDLVLNRGMNKLKLDKIFMKNHSDYMDKMEDFPEEWKNFMILGYFFSQIIFDPQSLNKFNRTVKNELSPSEELMLKTWKKTPPVWSVFKAEKTDEDDFFTITDIFTGEEKLLLSQSVDDKLKYPGGKDSLFLCALLFNGSCWATYGLVRQYRGLTEKDMNFLPVFIDKKTFNSKGLNGIINKFYAMFFTIDRFMEIPLTQSGEEILETCWSELNLEDFIPEDYLNEMNKISESGDFVHMIQKKESGVPGYELFYNRKTNDSLLTANTKTDYKNLINILNREYTLDTKADAEISMNLFIALRNYMDFNLPCDKWISHFPEEYKNYDPEKEEFLDNINLLLREKLDASNNGRDYDLKKRADEMGIEPEMLDEIEKVIKKVDDKIAVPDIEGGIEYDVPPPVKRKLFTGSLRDSSLFSINPGELSFRYFIESVNNDFSKDFYSELPEVIDNSFVEEFEEYGRTIMNTFFYILCQKKSEWITAKDYAAEILKLFGHVILPGLQSSVKDFIEDFTYIICEELVPSGIIEIETAPAEQTREKGRFLIRASRFFNSYISLKELE